MADSFTFEVEGHVGGLPPGPERLEHRRGLHLGRQGRRRRVPRLDQCRRVLHDDASETISASIWNEGDCLLS